jgi:hypothetical protein
LRKVGYAGYFILVWSIFLLLFLFIVFEVLLLLVYYISFLELLNLCDFIGIISHKEKELLIAFGVGVIPLALAILKICHSRAYLLYWNKGM